RRRAAGGHPREGAAVSAGSGAPPSRPRACHIVRTVSVILVTTRAPPMCQANGPAPPHAGYLAPAGGGREARRPGGTSLGRALWLLPRRRSTYHAAPTMSSGM